MMSVPPTSVWALSCSPPIHIEDTDANTTSVSITTAVTLAGRRDAPN